MVEVEPTTLRAVKRNAELTRSVIQGLIGVFKKKKKNFNFKGIRHRIHSHAKNSTFPHTLHSASHNDIIQYVSIVPKLGN